MANRLDVPRELFSGGTEEGAGKGQPTQAPRSQLCAELEERLRGSSLTGPFSAFTGDNQTDFAGRCENKK